jgi:hypothetical protein
MEKDDHDVESTSPAAHLATRSATHSATHFATDLATAPIGG